MRSKYVSFRFLLQTSLFRENETCIHVINVFRNEIFFKSCILVHIILLQYTVGLIRTLSVRCGHVYNRIENEKKVLVHVYVMRTAQDDSFLNRLYTFRALSIDRYNMVGTRAYRRGVGIMFYMYIYARHSPGSIHYVGFSFRRRHPPTPISLPWFHS